MFGKFGPRFQSMNREICVFLCGVRSNVFFIIAIYIPQLEYRRHVATIIAAGKLSLRLAER